MNSRVIILIMLSIILIAGMERQICSQVEEAGSNPSVERMNAISQELALDQQQLQKIKGYADSAKTRFEHLAEIQGEFEKHLLDEQGSTPEGAQEKYSRFLSDWNKAQKEYSAALTATLDYLNDILSEEQLKNLYGYLYNELWYEGLIRNDKVTTNRVQTVVIDTTIDTTAVLKGNTMEDLAQEMHTMLEMEGQSQKWQSEKFPPQPKPEPEQDGEIADVQLEPQVTITEPPPWQGMDLGPVTIDRIRDLLENKPQHILEFYWFDLAPRAEKMMQKRLQQKLQ